MAESRNGPKETISAEIWSFRTKKHLILAVMTRFRQKLKPLAEICLSANRLPKSEKVSATCKAVSFGRKAEKRSFRSFTTFLSKFPAISTGWTGWTRCVRRTGLRYRPVRVNLESLTPIASKRAETSYFMLSCV